MSDKGPGVTKPPAVGLVTAAVAFVLDRLTKYIMIEWVMRPEGVSETPFYTGKIIAVLPVFNLRMAWNTGISFSLFNSGTAAVTGVLIAVQVAIVLGLAWYLTRMSGCWAHFATGLILGGAIGNIYDRLAYGAVADFFDFYMGTWHFPTFNLADSCISVGVFLWLLDAMGLVPHHGRATPQED